MARLDGGPLSSSGAPVSRGRGTQYWVLAVASLGTMVVAIAVVILTILLPLERQNRLAGEWVEHTHLVIESLDDMLAGTVDAESAQRGFLLTRNADFLDRYDASVAGSWHAYRDIASLTVDNPVQQGRLSILRTQITDRLEELDRTIKLARAGDFDAALDPVRRLEGKTRMDALRETAAMMVAHEVGLLALRRARHTAAENRADTAIGLVAWFVIVCLVTATGAIVFALRSARAKATIITAVANERLRLAELAEATERRDRQAVEASNADLNRMSRHLANARDSAERANQAKSRFLAGASHELRTPLNGILGYAQLLHMDGGMNPTQRARVDSMMEAGNHLLRMITRVLDLSEIETERVQLHAETVDLGAVARECLDLMRPTADAKALTLVFRAAMQCPGGITADPTRLRQILLNLLGNAVKFTASGGIELRARNATHDGLVRIEVADTGAGIPEPQRQRLFREFERLDTQATRQAEGSGLGLALSARLAVIMGGRLGHDHNPDGGSVFWLELPVGAAAEIPPASNGIGAEPARLAAAARPLRVLVVDDVLMNRDVASSFLHAAGHETDCVDSGEAAVIAAAGADFDVVLMDVRMPGIDGLEAARQIRDVPGPRGLVPIVALTANAFGEQVAQCRAAGMVSHVAKPFKMQDLLAAVTAAAAPPMARLQLARADTAMS